MQWKRRLARLPLSYAYGLEIDLADGSAFSGSQIPPRDFSYNFLKTLDRSLESYFLFKLT